MDIVTLGAAKAQTESYVGSHFVAGSNITITENANGTQTIAASGEVSSEDTVARGAISDHVADKSNPHEVTASQVGLGNVNNTSDVDKPISTATQAALDLKANATDIPTVNNSTITIQKNGATVDSFTTNASSAKSINITVPTTASDVGALADTVKYAGSYSAGGSATSAVKLDNAADAGSLTQPIFFESGKPKATTYSLEKSVPSNAAFTDTTYNFEGAYNASTNKAATMADIKDGKLTGYAQASGDVAATDKVVEAIGKVEKKADDNKNNISFVASQGRKNVLKFDSVGGGAYSGITYTVNDDGTVRVSGTANALSYEYLRINNSNFNAKEYANGQFVLSGCPSGGGSGTYSLYAAKGNYAKFDYGDGVILTPTSESEVYIVLRVEKNQTVDIVFKPMIRLIGTDSTFEPYALSNVELTSENETNKNNISFITPTTYTKTHSFSAANAYENTGLSITVGAGMTYMITASISWGSGEPLGILLTTESESSNISRYNTFAVSECVTGDGTSLRTCQALISTSNSAGTYNLFAKNASASGQSKVALSAQRVL